MKNKLIITLGCFIIASQIFSQAKPDKLQSGVYILYYNGETSFTAATKVDVKMKGNDIVISAPANQKNQINRILKNDGTGHYSMEINDPMGIGKLTGQITTKTEFTGEFTIDFSPEAKKRFFTDRDEKGNFKLISFTEKKFKELKKEINDKLYNVEKYKSLEKMAKVSPYARRLLKKQKKVKLLPLKTFYGRVIDQYNDPVVGAKVKMRVSDTTAIVLTYTDWPSKIYFSKTDKNGCFSLDNMKCGYCPSIISIEKEGYTNISGHYNALSLWKKKYTTPTEPLIIKIRKKGANLTYLLQNKDFDFKLNANTEQFYSFITLKETWKDAQHDISYQEKKKKWKIFLKEHYDIKVNTVLNKEESYWIVTFTASGKNGGVIIHDDFLSEAPKQGYKKELKFFISSDKNKMIKTTEDIKDIKKLKGKYLYIKSRDLSIYTRMKIGDCYIYSDSKEIKINTSTATNPYGERNLEAMEVPYGMGGKFYQPIKKAFLKGKLPIKPDIKKSGGTFKKNS